MMLVLDCIVNRNVSKVRLPRVYKMEELKICLAIRFYFFYTRNTRTPIGEGKKFIHIIFFYYCSFLLCLFRTK